MDGSHEPLDNIWVAASDGDINKVKQFVKDGVSVNAKDENEYTPLAAAVSYCHDDLVAWLLQNDADPNLGDADNDRPLQLCENEACMRLLLEHGADPKLKNNYGQTTAESFAENEVEGNSTRPGHFLALLQTFCELTMTPEELADFLSRSNEDGFNEDHDVLTESLSASDQVEHIAGTLSALATELAGIKKRVADAGVRAVALGE